MQVTTSDLGMYLGKATLISGLLYAYYHFLLRDKQQFAWNRLYLMGAAALSVIVPFLRIPVHFAAMERVTAGQIFLLDVLPGHAEEMNDSGFLHAASHTVSWGSLIPALYGAVILVLLAVLVRQLLGLARLLRNATHEQMGPVTLVSANVPGTPFSFFRWVFWDRALPLDSKAGQQILRHELAHFRYRHSIDKLTLQIICIFLFPVFPLYLIRHELQLVHEYQADQEATASEDTDTYAGYLLQHALRVPAHVLAHGFYQHPLARRIAMMQFLRPFQGKAWTRWMSLPLFIFAVALCAFTVERSFRYSVASPAARILTVVIDAGHGGTDNGAVSGKYREKDINLAIAREVAVLSKDYPVKVLLTRGTDSLISVDDRLQICRKYQADLFVSIHTNVETNALASGIQNFVSSRNPSYDSSLVLGSLLARHLSVVYPTEQVLREQSRGIGVLSRNTCPAVLVECGYISNPKDAAFMSNPANQEKMARQMLSSFADYARGTYPKPLSVQSK